MNKIRRCKPLLGTYVEITIEAELADNELITLSNQAFSEIFKVQQSMSFHDPDSELSKLNQSQSLLLSESMLEVFTFINDLHSRTSGLFDPCIAPTLIQNNMLPTNQFEQVSYYTGNWNNVELTGNTIQFNKPLLVDLGGIAKGYAVDQAIECLPTEIKAVINAGGDLRMSHWQDQDIDITFQKQNEITSNSYKMLSNAVASSASYYNGHSVVINPFTGKVIASDKTYSIFANNGMTADALTKVAWLLNDERSTHLFEVLTHYDARLVIS